MSGEVINLADRREPPNPGNGARDALLRALGEGFHMGHVDVILTVLWYEGFKVVPLDGSE